MTSRPRHAVVTAASTCAVVGTLLLAGCSATNPITTQDDYDASDGVGIELGDVRLINVLVLGEGEGEPGVVVGSLTNEGDDADVTLALDGSEASRISIDAGETLLIGGADGEEVEVEALPGPPGSFVDLTVSSGAGTITVGVPVLDGTLPEYAEYMTPTADDEG